MNPLILAFLAFVDQEGLAALLHPINETLRQGAWGIMPTKQLDTEQAAEAYRRQNISIDDYLTYARREGYNQDRASKIFLNGQANIETEMVISAFRRNILDRAEFERRMAIIGWNSDDFDRLLQITEFYPSPSDLISFEAKGVYRDNLVKTFNLDQDFDTIAKEPFHKGGMNDEQLLNFWRAHWNPPSYSNVARFIQWGLLDPTTPEGDNQINQWFSEAAIPPFWRGMFRETLYEPFTRVDVRRMWDLGVIGDDKVIETYRRNGYSKENAEFLLTFTKVYEMSIDLRARYSKGWINSDDIKQALDGLTLDDDVKQRVFQRIVANTAGERHASNRDLTQAQILKGIKEDVISVEDGMAMLLRLGYDKSEAGYLIALNDVTRKGYIESKLNHVRLVEAFVTATGGKAKQVPADLLQAEQASLDAAKAVNDAMAEPPATDEAGRAAQKQHQDELNAAATAADYRFRQLLAQWEALPAV